MSHHLLFAFLMYVAFELLFRGAVLLHNSGKRCISWALIFPRLSLVLSPGYWAANNCKLAIPTENRGERLSRMIENSNLWNIAISAALLLAALSIRMDGYALHELFSAFILWRYISRSNEIAYSFASDVTSESSNSNLDNHSRMKLAIRSYIEIFIYSAAFYSAYLCSISSATTPIVSSLYVGTITNVSDVARNLSIPEYFVFFQVFATFSLVLLSIAGYLGRVKKSNRPN